MIQDKNENVEKYGINMALNTNSQHLRLDAQLVRAAMACQAGKDEPRYYLSGVYIGDDGYIVGTNGHVMFAAKGVHEPPEKTIIVYIEGQLSVNAEFLDIYLFENSDLGVCQTISPSGKRIKLHGLYLIDGKYPDFQAILNQDNKKQSLDEIGFNPNYMSLATKIFGNKHPVKAEFFGNSKGIILSPSAVRWPTSSRLIVMPARL